MADLTPAHELRALVRRARMPSSCRQVYDALLDHRGKNATAWVANSTLQEETGLDETTVRRACRALERTGWLVPVDDGRRVNEYQLATGTAIETLLVRRAQPVDADAPPVGHPCPPAPMPPQPGTDAPQGGHECAPQGGHGCPPNYSSEPYRELVPPVVPPAGDLEPEQDQPQPAQPELLSPTASPKPKQGKRPGPKPKTDPEQDPTWSAFAALAVEAGLVDAPPKPDARAPGRKVSRSSVIAEFVAEHGAERVLAVWRWVLTSPGRSATWWREARVGGELIGSFLRRSNFEQMADSFDGERKHGVKLEVVRGGRATFGQLPKIDPADVAHELDLARRTLATPNPSEEDLDDALCW